MAGASLASTYLVLEEPVALLLDAVVCTHSRSLAVYGWYRRAGLLIVLVLLLARPPKNKQARACHAALALLLRPCKHLPPSQSPPSQRPNPLAPFLSFLLATGLLGAWALTGGHWALSNAIGTYVHRHPPSSW